jgi:hypothetical protein
MKLRYYIILIPLFFIANLSFAEDEELDYCWIMVGNKEAQIELPCLYTEKYSFKWEGHTIYESNLDSDVIHGEGHLVFINKNTGYQSGKIPCEFDSGVLISDLKLNNSFYKCLDDNCEKVRFKLSNGIFEGSPQYNDTGKVSTLNEGIFFSKDNNFFYKGDFDKLKAEGFGKLCYGSSLTGKSLSIMASNDECPFYMSLQEGYFKNGNFINGFARVFNDDGSVYEGGFNNGVPQNWGKIVWFDQSKYLGVFSEGKKEGYGIYYFKDGSIYEGEWVDDKKSGYGRLSAKTSNFEYEGQFANGKIHGKGVITFNDKLSYIGDFFSNSPHGEGLVIDENGDHYKTIFEKGKLIHLQPLEKYLLQ